jgi:hypothetical protein
MPTPQIIVFDSVDDLSGQVVRQDSREGVFFARELEVILPDIYENEKPALNFLDLIPIKSNVPLGARTITYRQTDVGGKATFIGPESQDLPRVNVNASEESVRYKMIGVAAVYSYEDMQEAMMMASMPGASAGANLERDLIRAARRAIEEKVNECAWYGDKAAGIVGLAQNPNILRSAAANALSGSTTADQVLSVLNTGANAIPNETEQVEKADTLLLPPSAYQYASQQQRSVVSDTTTLKFWLDTNGYVSNARLVRELSAVKMLAGGVETETTGAIFYRKDASILELPYSGIQALPVQQQGMKFIVPFIAKVGSLIVRRPRAIHLVTGV